MYAGKKIAVIIPALNEEETLPSVLNDISKELVDEVVVVDNGSSDRTSQIARDRGATVLSESRRGYGYPCLRGIEHLRATNPEIVVFVDGNYSDHPDEIIKLVRPIVEKGCDLVIGSRVMGNPQKGALRFPVRFGNLLAAVLIRVLYGFRFTDVGPFRAIRFQRLLELKMSDNLGWTIEMQVKAVRRKFRILEVPVKYRQGTGQSKFTGDIKGIALIGYRIFRAIIMNLRF